MPPRSPEPKAPKDNEDVFLAITTIGPWVNNADTKIGLLVAALTVLTGGVVRQRPRVETLLDDGVHLRGGLALVALAVCVLAVIAAGAWLLRAVRPRLTNQEPSRFAFPYLANADLAAVAEPDPVAARKEAWIQAQTLAEIVLAKYTCFSRALTAGLLAGAAFVAWLLLVPG